MVIGVKKLHEIIAPLEEWEEDDQEGENPLEQYETEAGVPADDQDKQKLRHVLRELIAGILFFGIICEAVGVWFVKDRFGYTVGILIGVILAVAMAIHMAWTLDRALDLPQTDAQKKIRTGSISRYAIIVLILGIMMYTGFANPLAGFLGLMSLKVAAYLQPFTHKLLQKRFKNEEEPS